jgi:RhtB (resistance to homoserine/threonine) family protein
MLGTQHLAAFVVAGLLLNITPGPDLAYIGARSATQGLRAGVVAVLGISTGCLVHITAAALGLSAVLAASATAFTAVKWIGAAYLCYVGWSLWRSTLTSRGGAGDAEAAEGTPLVPPAPLRRIFAQGFLTNVLNPKVALFFLAFLPQFIDPAAPAKAVAFLFLGVIFDFNGTLVCLLFAWSVARAGRFLRGNRTFTRWLNRTVGTLFIALGARLALSTQR